MKLIKSALVISFSDLKNDPRVHRQLHFLKNLGFKITTVGNAPSKFSNIEHIPYYSERSFKQFLTKNLFRLLQLHEMKYWMDPGIIKIQAILKKRKFDLVIANDIEALPLGLELAQGAKLLYDAHEYSPRNFEDQFLWRVLQKKHLSYLCKQYLPKADFMMTVSEGLADEYRKEFGVSPIVFTNAPFKADLKPTQVDPDRIRLIHHGCANRSRHPMDLIDLMKYLDERFYLDLVLVPGDQSLISHLRNSAKKLDKIRFIPPVPMLEIPSLCNRYDIGIFPLRPSNFNLKHGLPNKLFEFIQARLATAIYPAIEMEKYVKRYNCGVVSKDYTPESLATTLNKLTTNDIMNMKMNAHTAAHELNAEQNEMIFRNILSELMD